MWGSIAATLPNIRKYLFLKKLWTVAWLFFFNHPQRFIFAWCTVHCTYIISRQLFPPKYIWKHFFFLLLCCKTISWDRATRLLDAGHSTNIMTNSSIEMPWWKIICYRFLHSLWRCAPPHLHSLSPNRLQVRS